MTAKKISDIAEALEKLGYEIVKIKEREGDAVFQAAVDIKLTPIKE